MNANSKWYAMAWILVGCSPQSDEHPASERAAQESSLLPAAQEANPLVQELDLSSQTFPEGRIVVHYPRSAAVFIEGVIVKGKKSGHWKYWYKSGNLMLEGEYEDGQLYGPWSAFKETGEPDPRPPRLECVDGMFAITCPGPNDLDWAAFDKSTWNLVLFLLPSVSHAWEGAGTYAGGVRICQ